MVNVYWIAKYPQIGNTSPHSHRFYQLLVPTGGEGTILIGETPYPALRGTALLARPDIPHGVFCEEASSPAKFIDIKFSVLNESFDRELQILPDCIPLTDLETCLFQLENLLQEAQRQEAFSSEVINMTFTIFLISLIRSYRGEKSAAVIQYEKAEALTSTYKGLPVSQLLAYINQNFNRIISLDDLTHIAHVSKTTLIDLFKELYGTTPIRYLNNLRMEKARELLANSDLSIGEISELVGFQSIHYFSRSFKEREGCTPLCYRKTHQDSRYITLNSRPV